MCIDYMYVVEGMEGMEVLRDWAPFTYVNETEIVPKKSEEWSWVELSWVRSVGAVQHSVKREVTRSARQVQAEAQVSRATGPGVRTARRETVTARGG